MRTVPLADGRNLAFDDVGDPEAPVVLYLHGTPDARQARHPDDGLVDAAGVRLLAPDRPGIGGSSPDPQATARSVADDLAALLDAAGIDRCGVLAWSAGAIFALAFAGTHPDRVSSLVLAAPLVPADAYVDPSVLEAADDGRRLFAELVGTMDPAEIGAELAPLLVPPGCDHELARELVAPSDVPGATEVLVDALVACVAQGMTGLERDVAAQAEPLGPLLDAVEAPVRIHLGLRDHVAPPGMGRWLGTQLPDTQVVTHAGGDHRLVLHEWVTLLVQARPRG